MEIRKPIPNYDNYEASNQGRIYRDGIILEPFINKQYRKVWLKNKHGERKLFKVSVLVAMAFLKHKPNGHAIIVDHKDEDKLNDYLSNLQLLTARKNVSKAINKSLTSSRFIGVSHYPRTNKWLARIRIKGKLKHLGYFNTQIKAYLARRKAY